MRTLRVGPQGARVPISWQSPEGTVLPKGLLARLANAWWHDRVAPVIDERHTPVSLCHLALSAPLERRVGLPSGRGDSQLIQLTEVPLKLNKEFGDAHDERPEHLQ